MEADRRNAHIAECWLLFLRKIRQHPHPLSHESIALHVKRYAEHLREEHGTSQVDREWLERHNAWAKERGGSTIEEDDLPHGVVGRVVLSPPRRARTPPCKHWRKTPGLEDFLPWLDAIWDISVEKWALRYSYLASPSADCQCPKCTGRPYIPEAEDPFGPLEEPW